MTIKIGSPTPLGYAAGAGASRRPAGSFALDKSGAAGKPAEAARANAASGVLGMDAILALQGNDDALGERRRRQIRRSRDMLDVLDEIKVGLLDGHLDETAVSRLQGLIDLHREDVEDGKLQGILNEIETRAFVELAKRRLM